MQDTSVVTVQTICLSMIVKDEAAVIRRCLDSVLPIIDSWAIVDTGSTDGTQEIVAEHMRDLPGTLAERPWVDFAHNRNEALDLARERADYVLTIDADEVLEYADGFALPALDADSYQLEVRYGPSSYLRKQLVRAALPWRYSGVVHEYLECSEPTGEDFLAGVRTVPHRDGARARDPETYRRDAELLEHALIDQPGNTRYVYYLAQSYRDAGDLEAAAATYRRRAEMGGWREEAWHALYQAAQLEEQLGRPWGDVMQTYLDAHEHTPDRAGPLFRVGLHYQQLGQRQLAHLFLRRAMEIPEPGLGRLFVERQIYEFARAFEYVIACYHVGEYATAIATANELLRSPFLPPDLIVNVVHNRRLSLDAATVGGPVRGAPRLTVVVPPTTTGPERDDCIESLDAQRCEDFRVMSSAEGVDEDDVVLILDPRDRLADPDVLELIRMAFIDGGCQLLYGQHRDDGGHLGTAEPAPDQETFAARGAALAGKSLVAARVGVDWETAGLAGTRFLDEVLTVRTPALPTPAPARASGPLISCLMVTRDRLRLAKAAITSFALQTHPNRELVIVTDGDERYRDALARFVAAAGIEGVRVVVPDQADLPLGQLRNIAIAEARGTIVCQWDDDDYSHPERLAVQAHYMAAQDAGACLLTDHLQLIERDRILYWVDWTDGGRFQGQDQLAPGTLMMAREIAPAYPEDGPFARRGEDSVLLAALFDSVPVAHLHGQGQLWLYTYHGANTFPEEHHRRLSAFSAPRAVLAERADAISDALAHMPVPRPAVIAGRDGVAFAIR